MLASESSRRRSRHRAEIHSPEHHDLSHHDALGLVEDLSWFTVPTMMLVSYFMIGMETTAEDVEQPFGLDPDDLPLDEICITIEKSVMQALPVDAATADV